MDEREPVRAVGINHVALEVGDLEEALAFYGRLFRLELRGRVDGMAFVDLGDQFLALAEGREGGPDRSRHFGLAVDDREALRGILEELGVEILSEKRLEFHDPWGNRVQIVSYPDIQYTKAPHVLAGMGLAGLEKTDAARKELADKGMAPPGP